MPSLPPQHLKLAKQLRGRLATSPGGTRRFWATVTAIDTGPPVTVTVQQGALTEISGLRVEGSLTPTVGMVVWGLVDGNDYQVCGTLEPPGGGGSGPVETVDGVSPDGNGNVALGALRAVNNLSDVASAATARANIGAGTSSLVLGTTSTTALAGNTAIPSTAADVGAVPTSRKVNSKALSADITLAASDVGALAAASNLSDLGSASTARANLGLGTAATVNTGTTSGTLPLLNSSGRLDMARLASGTPDGTKFVRDDGTLAVPSGGGGGTAPTWTTPSLTHGYAIPGAQAVRYCKDSLGWVHIEGLLYVDSSSVGGTIFILPGTMWPSATQGLTFCRADGASSPQPGYVDTNGNVAVGSWSISGAGSPRALAVSTAYALYASFYVGT